MAVPPSTESATVPEGTEALVARGATVTVMASVAPAAGMVVAAVRVVEVEMSELEPLLGQALRRLSKSMEPRPEASS